MITQTLRFRTITMEWNQHAFLSEGTFFDTEKPKQINSHSKNQVTYIFLMSVVNSPSSEFNKRYPKSSPGDP